MSGWELVFLGTMAAALVVMALAQMLLAREVVRVTRQAMEAAQEVRRDLRPILDKLQKITDDLSRASALAVVQAERLDQAMSTAVQRVDETMTIIQDAIVQPIRHASAVVAGVRAAVAVFTRRGDSPNRHRDEEDALFIG